MISVRWFCSYTFLLAIFVFCLPFSLANLRITEVNYDLEGSDSGGSDEWIEVVNISSDSIDAANLILTDASGRHKVVSYQGSSLIKAGEIAIVADNAEAFLKNFRFGGLVFDSSFNLRNESEKISILLDGKVLDSVSYTKNLGANGNGKTLHIDRNGNISERAISIGKASFSVNVSNAVEDSIGSKVVSFNEGNEVSLDIQTPPFFVGKNISFAAYKRENLSFNTPIEGGWSFGNGAFLKGSRVSYSYILPGKYVVFFNSEYDSISKTIDIVLPQVNVNKLNDTFIEIINNHDFLLDIGGWVIVAGSERFVFPETTLIASNNKVPILFKHDDSNKLFLVTDDGTPIPGIEPILSEEIIEETKVEIETEVKVEEGVKVINKANIVEPVKVEETPSSPINTSTLSSNFNFDSLKLASTNLLIYLAIGLGFSILAISSLLLTSAERKTKKRKEVKTKRKNSHTPYN